MITIKSMQFAHRRKRAFDAVISIEDPGTRRRIRFHKTPHPDHLILRFEDVDHYDPGLATPDISHVRHAVEFARRHEAEKLLIHCHVGVCRSTATGLAVIADRMGHGLEREAVARLMEGNPDARPNLAMVTMADEVLERDGRLVEAWNEMENSSPDFARYRAKKAYQLANERYHFAARPFDGYYRAMHVKPGTLASVMLD